MVPVGTPLMSERKSTVPASEVKKKQIEKLLDIMRLVIGMETRAKGPLNATTPWIWYIEQIIKILKRMNDIE